MKKAQKWALILPFAAVLFGAAALSILSPKKTFSENENRALAQLPKASLKTVLNGDFESDYEDYLSDQFLFRDAWIGLKTQVERAIGKKEINGVYFAGDDYLIESHSGTFAAEQAEKNAEFLKSFLEKYKETFSDGQMSVIIAPNAVEVLSDLLPMYAPKSGEKEYLTKLQELVPEGTWFDAESVLENHLGDQLFYRTDHHWTTQAAFYVYEAWAKKIGLSPLSLSDYTRETLTESFQGTIASKIGTTDIMDSIWRYVPEKEISYQVVYNQEADGQTDLYDLEKLEGKDKYAVFFGGNQAVVQLKTEADSERKLLILKDSYANCFAPFAIHDFSEVTMVDIRYFRSSLEEYIREEGFTDLLFLYNASGFAEDTSLQNLLM